MNKNEEIMTIEESIIKEFKNKGLMRKNKMKKPDIIVNTTMKPDIIIEVKPSIAKKFLISIPIVLILFIIILSLQILMTYKIVYAPVVGASFRVGGFSFISNTYQFSIKDISPGSEVIYKTRDLKGREELTGIGPIILKFKKGTVKKIGDWYIHIMTPESREIIKILGTDIMFVIDSEF